MSVVHIITSCTDRKRHPVEVALREIDPGTPQHRVDEWWNLLMRSAAIRTAPAHELYKGDHWSIAKTLPDIARAHGAKTSLWVVSAGYGLIPSDAQLRPYAATFSGRQVDSVVPDAVPGAERDAYAKAWWAALANERGPCRGAARSLAELAADNPRAKFLVLASPDYVGAMEDDLVAATKKLHSPRQLSIVTRRTRALEATLGDQLIPTDAGLQSVVGGALTSLHVRVGRKILSELSRWDLDATILRARYEALRARCPDPVVFDRSKMTDAEVIAFVRRVCRTTPSLSCTKALRSLRESGRACEQHRFKQLFHETRDLYA